MKRQESVKVICDKGCGKSFVFLKPQEKKLGDGVIEHMLKCPYCRREYPSTYRASLLGEEFSAER